MLSQILIRIKILDQEDMVMVGGKLVNSKSVEGKLVILAKMGGKLVICRYYYLLH
jgi:hypothetical protein